MSSESTARDLLRSSIFDLAVAEKGTEVGSWTFIEAEFSRGKARGRRCAED